MLIDRIGFTSGDLVRILEKLPPDTDVYCAPSIVNVDESETSEFIMDDEKALCVVVDTYKNGVTIGYR
jgi:hypothetical protein